MTEKAIVVDSSAIVAILTNEADAPALVRRLVRAPRRFINAATVFECSIVLERRLGERGTALLDEFLTMMTAEIVPFDVTSLGWARRAWRKFGKGVHPAGLNLGACVSYATAMHLALPLLFKGDDFARTDIEAA